jgi:HTH-type transcriptional repressor of NAD biosynthesis genes
MLTKPKLGFVLGKFMPPHQGHVFLCEFARQYCEKLVILVCSMPNEPIPGELRYQWMKEMFPDCTVVHETRVLPQEPKNEDDWQFWGIWGNVVGEACFKAAGTYYPDVIFASEDYGHRLAKQIDARFVPVDISRTCRAVSGTKIRENPFKYWEYIPHVVRPYYSKRVTLFGPESSGKSTLAATLGTCYSTVVVPEYGRTYTEAFRPDIDEHELPWIVQGHLASVAAAKRQANKILIEDTDPVMSAVWSYMLFDKTDPWFAEYKDYADLYILCGVDIPWEDDGTRYLPKQEDRKRFFDICEKELLSRGVNYVIVRGTLEERMTKAVAAIDGVLNANIS